MNLKDKKLILIAILISFIAFFFWSTSRYPALDEKAMMGGDTPIIGIGFDEWIAIDNTAVWWKQILINTTNWAFTNKQGMTFGLLFAAALMMLFAKIKDNLTDGVTTNTFVGMLIGIPLGVCVNCAAPIAQGVRSAGGRAETALSLMISSPSLNIVVLTMLFALFPTYIIVLKIVFTLLIITICIPLIIKFLMKDQAHKVGDIEANYSSMNNDVSKLLENKQGSNDPTWTGSIKWLVITYLRSTWHVIKLTLPLMILAGLLGNVLVYFVPFDQFVHWLPVMGRLNTLIFIIILAVIGTFLPVPMAFDIIISAILINSGLPVHYVIILLCTLGTYSIYAFLIARQAITSKVAIGLYMSVALLAVLMGAVGFKFNQWELARKKQHYIKLIATNETQHRKLGIPSISHPLPDQSRIDEILEVEVDTENVTHHSSRNIDITRRAYTGKSPGQQLTFSRIDGSEIGINESRQLRLEHFVEPFSYGFSIASGDVHNDGWTDILMTSDEGIVLYANLKGEKFLRQHIDSTLYGNHLIINAALIDFNNDGNLDIYYSTYQNGSYFIINNNGRFTDTEQITLPNIENGVMTISSSFGDVDKDGQLDILHGNMSVGQIYKGNLSLPSSRNVLLRSNDKSGENYQLEVLEGKAGETWTTLMTDIDNDGWLDMLCGNDFAIPDNYYLNNQNGRFRKAWATDSLFNISTKLTMSITSADINNDLKTDIYQAAASNLYLDNKFKRKATTAVCGEISDPTERERCISIMKIHQDMLMVKMKGDAFRCPEAYLEECLVFDIFSQFKFQPAKNQDMCKYLAQWKYYSFLCNFDLFNDHIEYPDESWEIEIHQEPRRNTLQIGSESGKFIESSDSYGIINAGWCWNAKFADLDNDQWQDLYVVNSSFQSIKRDNKFFFRNINGEYFTNMTSDAGLESFRAINSYSYIDIDNDGDLDIVAVPSKSPVIVYINDSQVGNSIVIELRDKIGNSFGIGSKVIIHYGEQGILHQMREIQAGGGFRSYDVFEARFGLGEHEQIESLDVIWSTGDTTSINQPFQSGHIYRIFRHM